MDMQPLWSLLLDPARTSIAHSAKQDMEVIWFDQGSVIPSLIDTQVCAGLLGHPAQIGYAGLVAELLNVNLSKSQTRTDWSRRPLSEAQLSYAEEDVEHLPEIHALLKSKLDELGRYSWATEDSAVLSDITLYRPNPSAAWQRVRSIPFLAPAEQARAVALAEWREARAVELNRPRQWIIADKGLLELASMNPGDEDSVHRAREIPAAIARKNARQLVDVIASANALFAANPEGFVQQIRTRDTDNALIKKLLKIVRARATELNIAAEVLASKREITALLQGTGESRVLTGWRRPVIGDALLAAL
jgi:ribonuclease D